MSQNLTSIFSSLRFERLLPERPWWWWRWWGGGKEGGGGGEGGVAPICTGNQLAKVGGVCFARVEYPEL